MATFPLPDGRTLAAEPLDDRMWYLRIEEEPRGEIVGWPLNATLAELLGYSPQHEELPPWIEGLAREIEGAQGT